MELREGAEHGKRCVGCCGGSKGAGGRVGDKGGPFGPQLSPLALQADYGSARFKRWHGRIIQGSGISRGQRHRAVVEACDDGGVDAGGAGDDTEGLGARRVERSEEHTSELQSLMRISYAVFCLKKKKPSNTN